jgi:multicomponent K+:H+ antiporter subunit A
VPRFFSFFLAFMGAMLGVVLSGNVIQLVFFWELTSLFSFPADRLLAPPQGRAARRAHGAHRHRCRRPGLLAGMLLLGHIVGSYELDAVLDAGERIRAHRAVHADAGADAAGRADQERAVPVPLLAAARHGRAHAGVGLPAFGHHGQGRRVPAGAAVAGAGGQREWFWLVGGTGCITLLLGAYPGHVPDRPEGRCWPTPPSATWG